MRAEEYKAGFVARVGTYPEAARSSRRRRGGFARKCSAPKEAGYTVLCFALCVIATLLALSVAGCWHKAASREDEGGTKDSDSIVAEVTLARVARADISEVLTFTGAIAAPPNRDVKISTQVAGRVAELKVAEGDHVVAGQVLARLDDRPLRDQLRQAEAAVASARANLENAQLALARNEDLFGRGIAARKELEDARKEKSVAEAALHQAEAALALARLQVARAEVRSPLTGAVAKRFVSVGEQVDGTAAQPIVEVASLNPVELVGNVPAAQLGKIHLHQTLPISSEAFAGKTFTGQVVAISPAVDPATNAGLIRIRIANPRGLLRLGMFVSAQVPVDTHKGALVVPPQAIYRDQQGEPRVYRVDGEVAMAVPVQTGAETKDRVELLSGVKEGDAVILTGGYGLSEKTRVKVKGLSAP